MDKQIFVSKDFDSQALTAAQRKDGIHIKVDAEGRADTAFIICVGGKPKKELQVGLNKMDWIIFERLGMLRAVEVFKSTALILTYVMGTDNRWHHLSSLGNVDRMIVPISSPSGKIVDEEKHEFFAFQVSNREMCRQWDLDTYGRDYVREHKNYYIA